MPTIAELVEAETLIHIGGDADGEQPWRLLYGTMGFVRWLDETLPGLETSLVGNMLSPMEQVSALFDEFSAGEPLIINRQFKQLRPTENSVWELKTDDLRIFGWFPVCDCFIAVHGAPADNVKDYKLYGTFVRSVADHRSELKLNCGFITSGDPNHVISVKYQS